MAPLVDVFNHLVLPPQIPGRQDEDIDSTSENILSRLLQAAQQLGSLCNGRERLALKNLRQTLYQTRYLHSRGRLEKDALEEELRNLELDVPILLHIAEQNAGLIICRRVM